MLYLLTFGFFIFYLAVLSTGVWFFVHRFLTPRIEASRGEAMAIFYSTMILSLILLIMVNYYTGFLAEIYRFFSEHLLGEQGGRALR